MWKAISINVMVFELRLMSEPQDAPELPWDQFEALHDILESCKTHAGMNPPPSVPAAAAWLLSLYIFVFYIYCLIVTCLCIHFHLLHV